MKIAISRGNKLINEEILIFFSEKYNFKTINVDSIIEKNIINSDIKEYNDYKRILLKIRNEINNKIIDETIKNNNVVISYSLLEDFDIFEDCDIKIKVSSNQNDLKCNYDLYKKYRVSCIDSKYDDSFYHLILDINKNWQDDIANYMDSMVYNDVKVSIVVPIYNTEDYISRLVNSVTNQTYRNLEIILIDDGSTDNSLKICKLLASKDSRIKVIHQNNVGLAETRNNGMKIATGEYIAFLDSDDFIDSTMIEELIKKAKETNADVCQGGFWIHTADGFIKDVTNEQNGPDYFEGKKELINAHSDHLISIAVWDKIYKLSSIRDIKFNKNVTKEDADYIYRLCMNEKSFAIVKKPFYHYIKRPVSSLTGNKISSRLFMLQEWGHNVYKEVLNNGDDFKDSAEKILFNSLVHIIRYYIRDYKKGILSELEFQDEIQSVVNDLMILLLNAKDVKKFRKLDEVLLIINELIDANIVKKENMPSINIPCVGILWNSLDEEMMKEAFDIIEKHALVNESVCIDLGDLYRNFIDEIYFDANEYIGVRAIKAGTLIDRYDTNNIVVLNLIIKVSNYIYNNNEFIFEEISELKSYIRNLFRKKIKDYAYDNIFHLTVNNDDYNNTNEVCKKYIRQYKGENYENK